MAVVLLSLDEGEKEVLVALAVVGVEIGEEVLPKALLNAIVGHFLPRPVEEYPPSLGVGLEDDVFHVVHDRAVALFAPVQFVAGAGGPAGGKSCRCLEMRTQGPHLLERRVILAARADGLELFC